MIVPLTYLYISQSQSAYICQPKCGYRTGAIITRGYIVAYLIYKFFNSRGTVCSCNASKKPNLFNSKWPFNKLKHFFMGVKESNMLDSGLNPRGQLMTASEYANQIAEIQKQQKTKRHTSMSSDNFSSSRSDSWRQHQFLVNPNQRHHHHHHHR